MSEPDASPEHARPTGPKRKGRAKKKHTVGKALLVVSLVLALVTGLGVAYLYRHLNGNLLELDVTGQLENRPDKQQVEGPKEPLNVLVMGSDTREGEGNNIDNLTGAASAPTPRSCSTSRPTGSAPTASASRATRWSTGPTARPRTATPSPAAPT